MKPRAFKNSIFFKVPFYIFIFALTTVCCVILFLYNIETFELRKVVDLRARMFVDGFKKPISALLIKGDRDRIRFFIDNLAFEPFIKDMVVVDKQGEIVAGNNVLKLSKDEYRSVLNDILKNKKSIYVKSDIKHDLYDVAVPIVVDEGKVDANNVAGLLYLSSNVAFPRTAIGNIHNYIVLGNLVLTVLLFIGSMFMLRILILNPLSKYYGKVKKILDGDYSGRINIVSNDELGDFARLINQILDKIEEHEKSLERQSQILSEYQNAIDRTAIVIKSDFAGKVVYVNKLFTNISSYTLEDAQNISINTLRGEDFSKDDIMEYWDTLLNKKVWKKVVKNKRKDGSYYYVNAAVYPITDIDGEVIEYIDVWHDVTELYELKEELARHRDNLEKIVEEKTEELKKAQLTLIQQEKLASIGQLAAGIAHELNNPIGFISSNFTVMMKYYENLRSLIKALEKNIIERYDSGGLGEAEKALVGDVLANINELKRKYKIDFIFDEIEEIFKESDEGFERIVSIINNLRAFSRIDYENKPGMYDINEGIRNTLVVARNEIKYVAEVVTQFGDVPEIECYGNEINQVLLNIIVNAAQAIGEAHKVEKGLIRISTWSDGENVYCEIVDNGVGIPDLHKTKIFDPFFTTKPPGKGTGLGLNVSYDIIVNKHHGEIHVESIPGNTSFIIQLPIRKKINKSVDTNNEGQKVWTTNNDSIQGNQI